MLAFKGAWRGGRGCQKTCPLKNPFAGTRPLAERKNRSLSAVIGRTAATVNHPSGLCRSHAPQLSYADCRAHCWQVNDHGGEAADTRDGARLRHEQTDASRQGTHPPRRRRPPDVLEGRDKKIVIERMSCSVTMICSAAAFSSTFAPPGGYRTSPRSSR